MKNLKKIAALLIVFTLILSLFTGCKKGRVVLNVYNWGEYIDETVLDDFEKKYNIDVNYETFTTNEDMYVKLTAGGSNYDVIFPSDYMIEKLIS